MGGFFGTVSMKPCINDLFYGTDYHTHLGTRRAGLVTLGDDGEFKRSIHNLENAYFRSKFEDELDKFTGNAGLGVISDNDAQPIVINSHLGRFAIVTVAHITNIAELESRLLARHQHFAELSAGQTNPTELVALLIVQGDTLVEGIENVFRAVKGSCSMLLLTDDGSIIAARDKLGRTPIIIGRKEGAVALAGETTSFPNLGYRHLRDLGPGEIVRVTPSRIEQLRRPNDRMQICSFLWVYYGFPTSSYEGVNVEKVRFACGETMGRCEDADVDSVCGIPDSGVGMAYGYSAGMRRPYARAISKYTPTWPRSFTPSNQERRNLVAKMKLIPNEAILKGQRMLFCDDSIVRGTQLRDNVRMLFDCGVREAHVRISCPPLVYGCRYIGFTSSRSDLELITRRIIQDEEGDKDSRLEAYATAGTPQYNRMVEIIRTKLGLTTLRFNTLDNLVKAIGLPKCSICTHCFDGSSFF